VTRNQQFFGFAVLLALVLGLGYAGLRLTTGRAPVCQVCGRAIHRDMRTVAFIGGRREVLCCPTCALSAGTQLHKEVRFDSLADFGTGRRLQPADAFAVEGSDVIPCDRTHAIVNRDRQPAVERFDRCSPSIIAFANRAAAERFASEHGGRVDTFLHLIQQPVSAAGAR
jgi:hypothetical protein